MLGYLCAYYRHYHPLEFLTSFLNNAANDDDIANGSACAEKRGIRVTMPKWGISRSDYAFDKDKNAIAKGLSSVKYLSDRAAKELYDLAHSREFDNFFDVLSGIDSDTSVDARQTECLIRIDFFSEFGNQRELLRINELYNTIFKRGDAKKIAKSKLDGTPLAPIVANHSIGVNKDGREAQSYTILDMRSIFKETEEQIKALHMPDLEDKVKIHAFNELMGYFGYCSGKEEDRRKLYVLDVRTLKKRKDGEVFGYAVATKSLGSGKESSFTVFKTRYDRDPIKKGDLIHCNKFSKDRSYWILNDWNKI